MASLTQQLNDLKLYGQEVSKKAQAAKDLLAQKSPAKNPLHTSQKSSGPLSVLNSVSVRYAPSSTV